MTTIKNNNYFKPALYIGSILLLAVLGYVYFGQDTKVKIEIKTLAATIQEVTNSVTATGTVEPVDQVEVGTQVSGLVNTIYVDYNSVVKKGQLLAELDKTNLQESVNNAEAQYQAAQNELNYYQQNYIRQKNMYEAGVISKSDYEQAAYQIKNTEQTLSQRKTALKQAKTNLGYATIYAPIDGIILSKEVEEGQTVAAAMSTPTLFKIAKDITKMQVEAKVDEADIGDVALDQRVSFTVDAYPQEEFSGKVRQIRLSPTTESNVVTYTVIIDAANLDEKLKPGLTATVTIFTKELKNVLTIPASALAFTPEKEVLQQYYMNCKIASPLPEIKSSSKKEKYVWVINLDQSLSQKPIEIGSSDGVNVEVLRGLDNGDEAIVSLEEVVAVQASKDEQSPFMPKRPGSDKKNKGNAGPPPRS